MKIVGLDTGFSALGWARLIETRKGSVIQEVGVITPHSLEEIDLHVGSILRVLSLDDKEKRPDLVVLEAPYQSFNAYVTGQTWRLIGRLESILGAEGVNSIVITNSQVKSAAGVKNDARVPKKDRKKAMVTAAWNKWRHKLEGTKARKEACADAMWIAEAGRILYERG